MLVGTITADACALSVTRIPTHDLLPGASGEYILTERINADLSMRIRAVPEQWVWMHARFEQDSFRS